MAKKTFQRALEHGVATQDQSVEKRFATADSLLLGGKTAGKSKAKATPATTKKKAVKPRQLVQQTLPLDSAAPSKPKQKPKTAKPQAAKAQAPQPAAPAASQELVREACSLLSWESQIIDSVLVLAAKSGKVHTRSEVIRAALKMMSTTAPVDVIKALSTVQKLKPGRVAQKKQQPAASKSAIVTG